MKTILLTGSNGFIGKYLEKRLKGNYRVIGLVNDLLDYEAIGNELANINPDIIIHLAARTEVEKSFYEPMKFSEINYCGTVNLIEQAKNLPNLQLFLFSSTMETYGWQGISDLIKNGTPLTQKDIEQAAFTEATKQNPNAPYAVAKVGGEKYLEYAGRAYNFPYCILRQTNTYGRWDNDFFVVEQIITQMLKNPQEINLGYKEPYRNFLFINDLIDLYEAVLKSDNAKGEVFVTGPNNALSIEQLVSLIAQKLNWKGKVNWNTKPARAGEIYYLNSNPQKAKDLLNWQPTTSLSDGLDKTILLWKEKLKV